MRKTLALVALSATLSAADLQDNVGVGLGTMIFKDQDGLISQISAATTNGTCSNQTFAISSGTCGAKRPSKFAQNKQVNEYTRDNLDALAQDMAAGSGEHLDALSELLAIPADQRAGFASKIQKHFSTIWTGPETTHVQVLERLEAYAPQV